MNESNIKIETSYETIVNNVGDNKFVGSKYHTYDIGILTKPFPYRIG